MKTAKFTPTKSPRKKELLTLFGTRFREVRKSKGITQSDVAEFMGSATPVISKIERGNTILTIMTFLSLCSALDVDPNIILDAAKEEFDLNHLSA